MGIIIEVSSIITPSSRRTSGPIRELLKRDQAIVSCIQAAFTWQSIPWEEPSEQKGIVTSANNSRFDVLLSLAWAVDQYTGELAVDSDEYALQLFGLLPSEIRGFSQQQFNPPTNGFSRFSQLLSRDIYRSYWLPVDIPQVSHLQFDVKDTFSRFSVGSSHQLIKEISVLAQITERIVRLKDGNIRLPAVTGVSHTWGNVHHLALQLSEASQQSIILNLPMGIFW